MLLTPNIVLKSKTLLRIRQITKFCWLQFYARIKRCELGGRNEQPESMLPVKSVEDLTSNSLSCPR